MSATEKNNQKTIGDLRDNYLAMGPFKLDSTCDCGLFSPEEIEKLEQYGHWFEALGRGNVPIITEKQKMFVKAQAYGFEPKGRWGRLWYRYIRACEPPF